MRGLAAIIIALLCCLHVAAAEDADSLRAALMAREMAMNAPGAEAADFGIELADGRVSALSAWRGAPVLLVLFDADCSTCAAVLRELPAVVPEGLAALAVYAEPDDALRAAALAEVPAGFTAGFDLTGVYGEDLYSPEFLPGIYLIDAAGIVTARGDDAGEMAVALRKIAE
ncbi:MAG: redoxin domain-containing protein [Muribaculaceae bacterium]|nr:redoxin domain-containing protein [Muribaculaceae bacterium]